MKPKTSSITRGLIIWLTMAVAVFWAAAVAVSGSVMRSEFDEVFDSALQQTSERLLPLLVEDFFRRDADAAPRRMNAGTPEDEEYLSFQLRDRTGRVLLHSHDAEPEPFAVPLAPGFANTATHRVFTQQAVSGTLFLQLADPLDHRWEAMAESAGALFIPLIPLLPLSVVAIWLIVRRALRPLERLEREVGARDGTNLAPLDASGLPRELGTIASSVDHLLDRLRAALESEREFAANSAHELRTPIAGALAQTQRLALELPEGEARTRARGIEQNLAKLGRLTEKLLQLARAEAGIGLSDKETELIPVVRLVMDEFRGRDAGRLALEAAPDSTLRLRVDVDAFAIAVRNLIENALLHGDRQSTVRVRVSDHAVSVSNKAAVVSAAELAALRERFKRGKAASSAGSGLGLAIASALAARMGGALQLISPASGETDGFEARIEFA